MKSNYEYLHDADSLSIGDFDKIHKENDLSLLKKNKRTPCSDGILEDRWGEINDEITKITGQNEVYIRYLNHRIDEAVYMTDYILNGNRFSMTRAMHERAFAELLLSEMGTGVSLDENLVTLSKIQGYPVKKFETSAREYFSMIKAHGKTSTK